MSSALHICKWSSTAGTDPKDQTWKGLQHPQPANTETKSLSGHWIMQCSSNRKHAKAAWKELRKKSKFILNTMYQISKKLVQKSQRQGDFLVLLQVPRARNTGSTSQSNEYIWKQSCNPSILGAQSEHELIESYFAPSSTSIQNYCTLGTMTTKTCIGVFIGKEVGEEKHSYYLTQLQSADRKQ